MKQDLNVKPGIAGGTAATPYQVLQAELNPEVFHAMDVIFGSFEHCVQALEHTLVTSQSIQTAIQSGFANANFQVNVPTTASVPTSLPPATTMTHLSAPHMTLQSFYGKQNENVQGWIGLAKEALTLTKVPRDLWTSVVVQHL
jgi:hypothetical protein